MSSEADSARFWENLYQSEQDHWDLGYPTPVFARLAAERRFAVGDMVVLGAGHGHDARLFARHGFRVTAVDFAASAIRQMQHLIDPLAPVSILQADIFCLPEHWESCFDYVLEYVTFCAILPARRAEYAAVVNRLLRPGGVLIHLAFPIGRRAGGPPYVVQPDHIIELFQNQGFQLQDREFPVESIPIRKGYEELLIFNKIAANLAN